MAQGTRGRWVRVATTGLGVLLCTGLVGCLNSDKDKRDKLTRQPTQGLHGTPTIGPNGLPITKNGQPNNQFGAGGVIQPAGGVGAARPGGGTPQPGSNPNYNPSSWVQPGAGGQPGVQAQPIGVNVQPVGVDPRWNGMNTNPVAPNYGLASAPAYPAHLDPLPPPPPGSPTASGSGFTVQPPTNNFAPIPPSAQPAVGFGNGTMLFGSK